MVFVSKPCPQSVEKKSRIFSSIFIAIYIPRIKFSTSVTRLIVFWELLVSTIMSSSSDS